MSNALNVGLTFILVGISFLIMSLGCIKNKWIVISGAVIFIATLMLFLIGFKDVIFVDNSKIGI